MRKHRSRVKSPVIAFLAVAALIAAGCGNGDAEDPDTDDDAVEDPDNGSDADDDADADDGSDADADDGSEAAGDDEIVIAVAAEPPDLNPGNVGHNEINTPGMRNVYETLVERDPETQELIPALATDWEQVADDHWQFTLREGVTFHDGSAFNAEAAAEALNFITDPELTADERGFAADGYAGPELTAEAADEYTLDVFTADPDPIFPLRAYFFHLYSVEAAADDPSVMVDNPVGTGPYRFVEWERGQYLLLEANEDWWGHDSPDATGSVDFDRARFVFRPESSVRASMIEAGEAHLAMTISSDQCAQLEDTEGAKCLTEGAPDVVYIRYDAQNEESMFTDHRVREAWTLSMDIESLASEVMEGGMVAGGQPVSEVVEGHLDELGPHPYDPDRAVELLEEYQADGNELQPVELVFQQDRFPRVSVFAEAVGAMAQSAGFDVEIIQMEAGAFTEEWFRGNQPPNRVQIHTHGNRTGDFGQTATYYREAPTGEGGCWCDDEELFAMIEEAESLSGEERIEAWEEVNRYAYEQIYMDFGGQIAFHYGAVEGLDWTPPPDHYFRLERMSMN